jgi:hypothetical protein
LVGYFFWECCVWRYVNMMFGTWYGNDLADRECEAISEFGEQVYHLIMLFGC